MFNWHLEAQKLPCHNIQRLSSPLSTTLDDQQVQTKHCKRENGIIRGIKSSNYFGRDDIRFFGNAPRWRNKTIFLVDL